jgi:hypothetical protein
MHVNNQSNSINQTIFETNKTTAKSTKSSTFSDYMKAMHQPYRQKKVALIKLLLNIRYLWTPPKVM